MFKNLENKAVKERADSTALEKALDYSARLEKEKSELQDQIGTLNIQQISHKSRWAFASFRYQSFVLPSIDRV